MANPNDHDPPLPTPQEPSSPQISLELARRIEISDDMLTRAAQGCGGSLIRAKKRFAKQREEGILRRSFEACCPGLPVEFPVATRPVPRGCVLYFFADRETLTWQALLMQRLDGLLIPVAEPGVPRVRINSSIIRVLLGWSQSYLDKYSLQLPGRTNDDRHVFVDPRPLLEAIGSPLYPFMVDKACRNHFILPQPVARAS